LCAEHDRQLERVLASVEQFLAKRLEALGQQSEECGRSTEQRKFLGSVSPTGKSRGDGSHRSR
jgi:hypothetical protein